MTAFYCSPRAVTFINARLTHVGPIANRMRAADLREVAAKGRTPKSALRHSLAASTLAMTAFVDDVPQAMFGVSPWSLAESVGRPWFLGTDEAYRHPREWLTSAATIVEVMQDSFRRLENVVSADNVLAHRMLRRLGFSIGADATIVRGVAFVPFWRGAESV